jgi:PKD repeat protein
MKPGLKTVRLTACNSYGCNTSTKKNYINVSPYGMAPIAVQTIPTLKDYSGAFLAAMGGNTSGGTGGPAVDLLAFGQAAMNSAHDQIGDIGFIMLYGLGFLMLTIVLRGKMIVPGIVGSVLGVFIIVRLPAEYQLFAVSAIGMSLAAIAYSMYKPPGG